MSFPNRSRSSAAPTLAIIELSAAKTLILAACLALITLTSCAKDKVLPTAPNLTQAAAPQVPSTSGGGTVGDDELPRGVTPASRH